jgi:hypothetical protein
VTDRLRCHETADPYGTSGPTVELSPARFYRGVDEPYPGNRRIVGDDSLFARESRQRDRDDIVVSTTGRVYRSTDVSPPSTGD